MKPPDIKIKNLSPYRENYFQLLGSEVKPFNLKKGLFTSLVDKKLPFKRERGSYDPEKEYSLHGRKSSREISSIYHRG